MKTKREHAPCICGAYDHKNGSCLDQSEIKPEAAQSAAHTPPPWKVWPAGGTGAVTTDRADAKTHTVCRTIETADAAFIVRAVNAHEIMYEALQACLNSEYVDQYGTHIPVIKGELRQQIAQAIAKAEGR